MTKILVVSDLHLDVNKFRSKLNIEGAFISYINEIEPEITVIAGDISNNYIDTIAFIESFQKHTNSKILFIPGNHDIWASNKDGSNIGLEFLQKSPSCLINSPYEVNEHTVIIGDIGWYDYSLSKIELTTQGFEFHKSSLWDGRRTFLERSDLTFFEERFKLIEAQLEQYKTKNVIFVNHFVPYESFVIYKGQFNWDVCNAYMGSKRLGWLLNQYLNISHVVFGHTHHRFGTVDLNGKKIICNPLGYFHEWETDDFNKEIRLASTIIEL